MVAKLKPASLLNETDRSCKCGAEGVLHQEMQTSGGLFIFTFWSVEMPQLRSQRSSCGKSAGESLCSGRRVKTHQQAFHATVFFFLRILQSSTFSRRHVATFRSIRNPKTQLHQMDDSKAEYLSCESYSAVTFYRCQLFPVLKTSHQPFGFSSFSLLYFGSNSDCVAQM